MTGIESLNNIRDETARENIRNMSDHFVAAVDPLKVILFGSFADGSYTDDSDYDFYLVVEDDRSLGDTSFRAHKSIRDLKDRPVDIVVGHNSYFEQKGKTRTLMVEGEVHRKGILLYERGGMPS